MSSANASASTVGVAKAVPAKVWIEEAECLVPKEGTHQKRLALRGQVREQNPQLASEIEAAPWYRNPDDPSSRDDHAIINLGWIGEDGILMGTSIDFPIRHLPKLKSMTFGEVRSHSVAGADDGAWVEFSFAIKASDALAMLVMRGSVPQDSVLMNETEAPLSCEEVEA